MTRDEAKEIILRQKPDFLQRAKVAGYICPQCGNGSGGSGTGITLHKSDGRHYKCFKCGLYEDIVGLWKLYSGVSDNNAAFEGLYDYYRIDIDKHITDADSKRINEGYKRMKEQKEGQKTGGAFGFEDVVNEPADYIELEDGTRAAWPKEEPEADDQKGSGSGNEEPAKGKELQDYTAFFLKANKDLPNTNYYRGISFETLNRYKVGYVEKWQVNERAPYSPRLIIPTSKYSYIARDTRDDLTGTAANYKKMKTGPVHVFNAKRITKAERPVYIVEGEIDALSIIDVGGEAVGLGSITMVRSFLHIVEDNRAEIKQPFIIALDNEDKKEVKAAVEKLKTGLQQLSIPYIEYNPCGAEKDANDALQKDRAAFTAAIEAGYNSDALKVEVPTVRTEEETLQKIRDLMDALRGCDTFDQRKQIEQELLSVANGDGPQIETPEALDGLLTYDSAVNIFETANDKYIELKSFPTFGKTAKIKVHDSIVIAADTGAGKSSLAINFLNDLNGDYPCMYINLEMDTVDVLRRLTSIYSGMELDRIEGYKNDPKTAEAVNLSLQALTSRKPLQVIQGAYMLQDIESIIDRSTAGREEPTIIFIDHSLLVDTKSNTGGRYDRFTQVSEGLRKMALKYNIVLFILLQQNRSGKATDEERPRNSSLKESGSWENDATQICFLWYDPTDRKKKILLTKNRHGSTGEFTLNYWKKTQTYTEATDDKNATKATAANWTAPEKPTRREKQRQKLIQAYEDAQIATHGRPTLRAMAEAADVTTATVKGWIREYGGCLVDGIQQDPAGIDTEVEYTGFIKLTPADDAPFDDPAATPKGNGQQVTARY